MDLENIAIFTQKELLDARRNRWFLLYTIIFAVLSLALAWLSLVGSGNLGLAGFGRTGASMINLILLIVPLMGLTLGALSLSSEREKGTLLYLLAQPITRTELLLGKFGGLSLALFLALGLGFGLSGLIIGFSNGFSQARTFVVLLILACLLAAVTLSIGFLISVLVKQTATAVGVALFIWLMLVFFGDLGLMGTALVLHLDVGELLTLSLLNPIQVFKIAAILDLRSNLEILGPAGLFASRTFGTSLLPFLVALLVTWVLVPLSLTLVLFRKRGAL